mmetsp:Transcript_25245/g.86455  ORF Transcript_25245/g.86455 Transcript_25245/m.86455 type:complete len:171 (-) Transcript_25245:258-770(-)
MKPAWDKLGDEYKSSKSVLIGDVDCTVEKDLCSKYGVRGYPTIKYFTGATAADGDKYEGGRDYDTLSQWTKDNLGPSCDPAHLDLCDDEQKKDIETKMAMSEEDLQAEVDKLSGEMEGAEETLNKLLESLQKQYEDGKKAKEDEVKRISPLLRLARGALKAKKDDGKAEL